MPIQDKAFLARTLIDAYAPYRGGPVAVREELAFHLRERNIRAKARYISISKEPELLSAWRNETARQKHLTDPKPKRASIASKNWWNSVDWQADQSEWDFRRGRFHVTLSREPSERLLFSNIRFNSADVQKHFGQPKNKPGAPRDADQWRLFWFEVIRLIQNGRQDFGLLQDAGYASNEKLTGKVVEHLSGSQDDSAEIASRIRRRLRFDLGSETISNEVKLLRRHFGLTKK
jgi:hypothetical protein